MNQVAEEAPEVAVRGETADGEAGPVLVDAARGADLLVVGSHDVGGFERVFLGSGQCVLQPPCALLSDGRPLRMREMGRGTMSIQYQSGVGTIVTGMEGKLGDLTVPNRTATARWPVMSTWSGVTGVAVGL